MFSHFAQAGYLLKVVYTHCCYNVYYVSINCWAASIFN